MDEPDQPCGRKRPHPAVLPVVLEGDERYSWLRCYATDPEFGAELEGLYQDNAAVIFGQAATSGRHAWVYLQIDARRDDSGPLRAYVEDLEDRARAWGLDRLRDDVRPTLGYDLIHEWCCLRASVPVARPAHFGLGYGYGFMEPDVGEVIESHRYLVSNAAGDSAIVVDEVRVPRVTLALDDAWYAEHESLKDARARILRDVAARVDAELVRIACDYERAGYVFPDTAAERDRNRRWLYRRVAYGETPKQIAEDERAAGRRASAKLVSHRTVELARLLGLGPLSGT
jgi:hypothetical protein